MDFDFLNRQMLEVTREAVVTFRNAIEGARPSDRELKELRSRVRAFPHTKNLTWTKVRMVAGGLFEKGLKIHGSFLIGGLKSHCFR